MTCSVLLVNSWRVINAKGGTEKVFCNLANALNRRGYSVVMLCCDPKQGRPGFDVDPEVFFLNVGEEEFFAERVLSRLKSLSFDSFARKQKRGLLKVNRLARLLAKEKESFDLADVVISFQPETSYILKKKLRVTAPIISMFHHDPKVYFEDPLFESTYRGALSECEVLQVLRPEYVKEVLDVAQKVVYIPNACPEYKQQKDLFSHKIVTVGRVNLKQKRTDLLVEAFSLLKDDFPDWTVEVWGELGLNSRDTRYVAELIDKHGLRDRVFLKGVTDDVESVLRSSSIFAFPSSYEGFSLSLIEAMMVGIPPVGCVDCSGVNTLIESGSNGVLAEPNPQSFAAALRLLMANEEKRLFCGEGARRTAEPYNPDAVWTSWERLIDEVVGKTNKRPVGCDGKNIN